MQNDPTIQFLNHIYAAAIIGLSGGATWTALVLFAEFPAFTGLLPMVRLTTLCALVGGILVAPLFGRDGLGGMAWALFGAVLATTVGSMLAVGAVEGVEAAFYGPPFVMAAVVTNPTVGGVWLLFMVAAHLVAAPAVTPESSGSP